MKTGLLFLFTFFSLLSFAQNIHRLEADSATQYCVGYLMKVPSWKGPDYYAIIDNGTTDLQDIEVKLFWKKRADRDSMLIHDSTGKSVQFYTPMEFLNFMYAHHFELDPSQRHRLDYMYPRRSSRNGDDDRERNYFFFRRRN